MVVGAISVLTMEAVICSTPTLLFYLTFTVCDSIGVIWLIVTLIIPPGFSEVCMNLCHCGEVCDDCCYGEKEL